MGIIVTNPSKNKKLSKSTENLHRVQEIYRELNKVISEYDVRSVLAESMSYPRNSASAAKMSMCWGAIGSLCEIHRIECHQASPQRIKNHVTGLKKASKEEVQYAIDSKYPTVKDLCNFAPSLHNHAYDALAATITLVESINPLDIMYSNARCLRK